MGTEPLPLEASTVLRNDFSGPVVSILDGNTLEILHNNKAGRIRLYGIDCPEKAQTFGQKVKHTPQSWSLGKKSRSRPTARTTASTPWPMCCYQMGRTSIMNWSRRLVLVVQNVCAERR